MLCGVFGIVNIIPYIENFIENQKKIINFLMCGKILNPSDRLFTPYFTQLLVGIELFNGV